MVSVCVHPLYQFHPSLCLYHYLSLSHFLYSLYSLYISLYLSPASLPFSGNPSGRSTMIRVIRYDDDEAEEDFICSVSAQVDVQAV